MSVYHRVHVALSKKERRRIAEMLSKGRESARVLRRAWILRQLDMGQNAVQAAASSGAGVTTVRRKALVNRFGEWIGGLLWDRFTVHYTPKHETER
jgi:hypothetical protein